MDKEKIITALIGITLLVAGGIIGWGSNNVYKGISENNKIVENKGAFEGLRFVNEGNQADAVQRATETNNGYGHWICINVIGMDYENAMNTCVHEVGHEIFATACAKNETKCLEAIK